ncbi:uncharacterized protein LODBEIA_P12740 [Lodderomyces beijingensis]|uniref:MEMO1 family protein n=1 Tax=Lodderomyces beijingensis TaxID=1775926 RepID=A0ABP0ZL96_9ASCO
MSNTRPATHAGSWYSGDTSALKSQIDSLIAQAQGPRVAINRPVEGARVLIGPHAGYTFAGERLAETYNVWDASKVKRVFILGPSHHVYFKNHAMLSPFDIYETPLGNLEIDRPVVEKLLSSKSKPRKPPIFKEMSEEVDEDEHSFEMHAPFIYHQGLRSPHGPPKIIPIMISGMDYETQNELAEALLPFLADEENHFVISSDFCHWGSRFGYTTVLPERTSSLHSLEKDLVSLTKSTRLTDFSIHASIENLDRMALDIATKGSSQQWKQYIRTSENTICGQKPISIVLQLLEKYGRSGATDVFQWIGYSQSNPARSIRDSSVSYASGYVKL